MTTISGHEASAASSTYSFPPIHIVYDVNGGAFAYCYFGPEFVLEATFNASLILTTIPGRDASEASSTSPFSPVRIVYDVYGGSSPVVTLFRKLSSRSR